MSLRYFVFGSRIWSLWAPLQSVLSVWGVWVSQCSQPWALRRIVFGGSHLFFEVCGVLSSRKVTGVCIQADWCWSSLGQWVPAYKVSAGFRSLCPDIDISGIESRANLFSGVSSLNCLWVYVPRCEVPELFVAVCPKYGVPDMLVALCCSLRGLCSWVCVPGCEGSELFECVCMRLWGLQSVWVWVSPEERCFICLWVYIPGC